MAKPNEKLAASLAILRDVQKTSRAVIDAKKHAALTRVHRERLLKAGYLAPVMPGWYVANKPDEATGDSTTWYGCMDEFIAAYATSRFGARWQVPAELSLQRHSGESSVVKQITIHSPDTSNHPVQLLHGCSLFLYKIVEKSLSTSARPNAAGLRLLPLEEALVDVSPHFFKTQALAAQIALRRADGPDLTRLLLEAGKSVVAGRIAGGLRAVGRDEDADQLLAAMRAADYVVHEFNPFEMTLAPLPGSRQESPYVQRIRALWVRMRPTVLARFDGAPKTDTANLPKFLADIEARYVADAYHSLSIEGYQVTDELIEKVRTGSWDPELSANDRELRNAMAAKGYSELHKHVVALIEKTLSTGANPGEVLRKDFSRWYLALFSPSVTAGITSAAALAGYRNTPVYIRNALHVPPAPEWVRECMPVLMEMLQDEPDGSVRAVLGHFVFVYIHPYLDGNGRIARFLMNFLLCTAGFRWTIVTMQVRTAYMAALAQASTHGNMADFADLLVTLLTEQSTHPVIRGTQRPEEA